MGLLDLPSPIFSELDASIGLPDVARLVVWGVVAAVLSTGLYALLAPQRTIARLMLEERQLKAALRGTDVAMADGMRAARRLLVLALARIALTLGPVLAASVPVLSLMVWLDTRYAHELPLPGQIPAVRVQPASVQGQWIWEAGQAPRIELAGDCGEFQQVLSLHVAVPVMHKRTWWNGLVGNPAGYLAAECLAERIDVDLPARHYLSIGPDWLRGWEAPFVGALLAVSLGLKLAFRLR